MVRAKKLVLKTIQNHFFTTQKKLESENAKKYSETEEKLPVNRFSSLKTENRTEQGAGNAVFQISAMLETCIYRHTEKAALSGFFCPRKTSLLRSDSTKCFLPNKLYIVPRKINDTR